MSDNEYMIDNLEREVSSQESRIAHLEDTVSLLNSVVRALYENSKISCPVNHDRRYRDYNCDWCEEFIPNNKKS